MEECEDAKIKSENRSLKTFLSHSDADESVTNDPTEVTFHHIQPNKFWFPSTSVVYIYCTKNYLITSKKGNGERCGGEASNVAKTSFMFACVIP